nr:putative late blight resistance protein homolog R1A-10 [Ipomoea trifida]
MDAVVDLLISKVAQTVEENASLILGIKDQVEDLLSELRSFKAYLTEASKNESCNANAVLRDVVQKIQKVVTDAEDAIDKYLVDRRNHRAKPVLVRWAEKVKYYAKVNEAAKEIESIKKRAEKLRLDHADSLKRLQDGSPNNPQPAVLQAPVVEEDEVIGFDEEAKTIKNRLTEKLKDTVVISIVGMAGLGKTTLTNMVFNDRELHYDSFTRLWIHVSRNMNRRRIFMDIISKFTKETRAYKDMSEEHFIDSESKPSGEHIRSLLTSTKYEVPKHHLATIPKSYPLLKVFDVEDLKFDILPKEFYQLYHLRYLAVTTELKIFPKPFTNLWNTQTLVFNTSQSSVEVKAEIWKLTKLRHLLANASLEFPTPENCRDKCEDLQTLSSISPKSCTEAIFDKMPNLLKLGIRGNLVELLEKKGGICLFDNIGNQLSKLQNLKLVHETANSQGSILRNFPRADKFPTYLRKLTLSNTSFEWNDISILGSLDGLEVLKLEEFAVKGDSWELNNTVVFKSLQFLRIGRTDLAYWTSKETSFPALKKLYLLHCTNLNAVPLALKDVKGLKFMELFCTNKNAATSARKIQNLKPKEHGLLELSVYPPNH